MDMSQSTLGRTCWYMLQLHGVSSLCLEAQIQRVSTSSLASESLLDNEAIWGCGVAGVCGFVE